MIECCDGCLQKAKKYRFQGGQWLCIDCAEHGTPLQRAAGKARIAGERVTIREVVSPAVRLQGRQTDTDPMCRLCKGDRDDRCKDCPEGRED